MSEFAYRPVTAAYDREERWYIKDDQSTQENIDEVLNSHESIVLYFDSHVSVEEPDRSHRLTSEEREHVILRLLEQYGVLKDFHSSILHMQTEEDWGYDRGIFKPTSDTFARHKPSLSELLEELGNVGVSTRDGPNDFLVGMVFGSEKGLVVLKYRSETVNYESNDETIVEEYEYTHQLELYPLDMIAAIHWWIR